MHIIKCTMKNLDEVAKFYDKVTDYLSSNINYPKWIPKEYPGRESTKSAILKGEQYACMKNDKVVGAFILNEDPHGNYDIGNWKVPLKTGEYMVIHTLASDPDMYKQGISKFMVEFCIKTAKENQYKAVRLDVVPDNIPAKKLYEGMGFDYACDRDIARGFDHIPLFSLYEFNFDN